MDQTPQPSRILIIRPSALGDVCRSVPVLASLRRAFPQATIDWLVRTEFAPAVASHPALSAVVDFPRSEFSRWVRGLKVGRLRRYLRSLRDRRYDLVIDAQGLARSGLLAWATRAPVRVGYADARECGWLGLTKRVRAPRAMHTVERALALVEAVGVTPARDGNATRLYTSDADRAWAAGDERLREPYAVIAPTSAWRAKEWPAERFARVASHLTGEGHRVVVVGAGSERARIGPLVHLARAEARVIDLVGQTTIGQLMAVIERATLVVANDSAALQMAVGFARPLVALFGATPMDLASPFGRQADVIQHVTPRDSRDYRDERAGRPLMERISVDEVVAACLARLRAD